MIISIHAEKEFEKNKTKHNTKENSILWKGKILCKLEVEVNLHN